MCHLFLVGIDIDLELLGAPLQPGENESRARSPGLRCMLIPRSKNAWRMLWSVGFACAARAEKSAFYRFGVPRIETQR